MPDDDVLPFDLAGCLDRIRQRDQAAARELVDHLYPLVIRIVRSHLPRRVAEEDLTQEVFIKMFTRLDQYQGAVPFPHWVSRIAVTTCIDHLRAQKRRPEFRWADLSENEAEVLDAVMTNETTRPKPPCIRHLQLTASGLIPPTAELSTMPPKALRPATCWRASQARSAV